MAHTSQDKLVWFQVRLSAEMIDLRPACALADVAIIRYCFLWFCLLGALLGGQMFMRIVQTNTAILQNLTPKKNRNTLLYELKHK